MSEGIENRGPLTVSAAAALEALRKRRREVASVLPVLDGSQPPPLIDRSSMAEAAAAERLLFRGSTVRLARRSMGRSDRMAAVLGAHAWIRSEVAAGGGAPGLPFVVDVEGEPDR
jgi:hypothetical protein